MDVNEKSISTRILILETKLESHERNFSEFRTKMASEISKIEKQLDSINTTTHQIKETMARYMGIGITLIGVAQVATSFLLKMM